jgi:hypothetical protein
MSLVERNAPISKPWIRWRAKITVIVVGEDEDMVGMGRTVQEDRPQKYVVVGVDNT